MSKSQSVIYGEYLKLETLLSCQQTVSEKLLPEPAHDEMLFIVIHQAYELWFKQILHELTSVIEMFDKEFIDEQNIGIAVARLHRIMEIEKLMIKQIDVLETMTPLDFLDFRHLLIGASGFQSGQFRLIENFFGLRPTDRLNYTNCPYHAEFNEREKKSVIAAEESPNLFSVLDDWLARTPFLDTGEFNFVEAYGDVFREKMALERKEINANARLSDEEQQTRLKMIDGTEKYVFSMLDENSYNRIRKDGHVRFSYKAFMAAVFINLYRDQPILHLPFQLLSNTLEVDEYLNLWRHRHALMVHRMIGSKMGTGGSKGHEYLQATTESHRVFTDLFNLSTLLISRSELPVLPESLRRQLGFYHTYSATTGKN